LDMGHQLMMFLRLKDFVVFVSLYYSPAPKTELSVLTIFLIARGHLPKLLFYFN